jgi:hypothetical protein
LALFGSGERDRDDFTKLFAASGLQLTDAHSIGHDLALIECAPSNTPTPFRDGPGDVRRQ